MFWYDCPTTELLLILKKDVNLKNWITISAIASGAYEKFCVLFNLAAMMTQIAEVLNHESDDGLKTTAKFYQVNSKKKRCQQTFIPFPITNAF